ncbi:hypothetical protein [Streptomyces lavendofoliae]|uniref:hypothetical protein n=1 Tax=Streptomyces lavendofoliae TaxID=67314 RepID=UPI00300ED307
MAPRPLVPPRPRPRAPRRLLLGLLCSVAAALLVRGVTLLLPGEVTASVPGWTPTGLVLVVALALGGVVYARTRRTRPRPPR